MSALAKRRAEDQAIVIGMLMRVSDINAFVRALDGSGLAPRLLHVRRGELARRRGDKA